jgi:transposase
MTQSSMARESQYAERSSILSVIPAEHVYLAVGFTDMRQSIDGLAAIVQQVFKLDPCAQSLFLFCGRRGDRVKALFWEGDGFVLLYKRLESGRFQWPRREPEARLITGRQLRWLLDGLSIEQPRALAPAQPKRVV